MVLDLGVRAGLREQLGLRDAEGLERAPVPGESVMIITVNTPDWVSNGVKWGSVHGEREKFTRLFLGCIEAKFCK